MNDEHLCAATTHFDDDRSSGREIFFSQSWLNPQKRHTADFGFVENVHVNSGGNVNSVDEREPVRRLAHGARRDAAQGTAFDDAVRVEHLAVTCQSPHAIFDRCPFDHPVCERVLADRHRARKRFERAGSAVPMNLSDGHPNRRCADVDHRDRAGRLAAGLKWDRGF